MKRTLISILMIFTMMFSSFSAASADGGITIYVNDEILDCDTAPFITDGRTMVPMRKIFDALDADVTWEGETKTVTAVKNDSRIVLRINDPVMYNNDVPEALDAAPVIVDDSTFVPLRAVSQSLNASVDWLPMTKSVYINSAKSYSDDYEAFLDDFMLGTVPAGYELFENVADSAAVDSDICVQGAVTDIGISGNGIYLTVDNRNFKGEKIAVYIGDTESTSLEKMTELFKSTNISVGGRYLGVTDTFNMPVISLHYVTICESESWYEISELTYPKLSLLGQTATLYLNGTSRDVPVTQVDSYLDVGWTYGTFVTVYAADGRTLIVPESEIPDYLNVGWYSEPVTTMYAADGRTLIVPESEVADYLNVGWYSEPVATMYAADGRTLIVPESEIPDYLNVGWYSEPVTTMYAADGRTLIIPKSEVSSYRNVGWYTTREEAYAASSASRSNSSGSGNSYASGSNNTASGSSSTSNNRPNSGGSAVYRTPYGERYHFDPDCGGKNSYQISLEAAKKAGLTPCKKCAR